MIHAFNAMAIFTAETYLLFIAIVFFNALSGSEAYAKMKRIDYKSGLLFAGPRSRVRSWAR